MCKNVSFIYKLTYWIVSKVAINKEDLFEAIVGSNQSKRQVEANVSSLISDVDKILRSFKMMNSLTDYIYQPKV